MRKPSGFEDQTIFKIKRLRLFLDEAAISWMQVAAAAFDGRIRALRQFDGQDALHLLSRLRNFLTGEVRDAQILAWPS
jgi:hypothetical protein